MKKMGIDSYSEMICGKLEFFISKNKIYEQNIDDLETVCLFLGPYRNLTTLTASLMYLHPNVQVLNHGGIRVFNIEKLNFLQSYSDEKFRNFCKFAIYSSQGGRTGDYGGSITFSHTFDHNMVKQSYQGRYGDYLLKDVVKCLVWKESLMTSNYIREYKTDLSGIFRENRMLRFMMPVRNPLDCAFSNCRTGHAKRFVGLQNIQIKDVLDAILREFAWFLQLKEKYPDRFFYFFQDELNKNLFLKIADFLEIEPEKQWIHDALNCIQLKEPYEYEPGLVEYYNELIDKYFKDHPNFSKHLKPIYKAE